MSFSHWLAIVATIPLSVFAQPTSNTDPSDPKATVPALTYQSAFKNYQSALKESSSPDQVWRSANSQAQSLGGHGGHVKATNGQSKTSTSESMPSHQGHAMDHQNKEK